MILAPKPPKAPQNVTVSPVWILNGSLMAELRWTPPVSDLPLQRYRVFWSRRLHGAKALDSVLVHQQVVPKVKLLRIICATLYLFLLTVKRVISTITKFLGNIHMQQPHQ